MAAAERPWRVVPRDLFTFTTTELHELHVAVMVAFDETAVFQPSMNLEQVNAALEAVGWNDPVSDDQLHQVLAQLVRWRLLDAAQDHTARYATPDEFERRNLQWSLTPAGQAAVGGVLHALQLLRRSASLQPAVLDAIADGLGDLGRLLGTHGEEPRISTRLAEVEGHLQSLVENVRQFNTQLQRLLREDATSDEVFLDVKRRTVTYLEEYITGIERPTHRVATGIRDIEAIGASVLFDRALQGANLAPVPGLDPAPTWLAERVRRWAALRAWFAPADLSTPRIDALTGLARQAIIQLLRVLERRWESRRRAASIAEDFRALACWFATAATEEEAHRLFNAAFGLWPARHAHLLAEDHEAVPTTSGWCDAPPVVVAPALRTTGTLTNRGHVRPIADPAVVRARRQREQAEILARAEALRAGLVTNEPVRLSFFARLDRACFGELLELLGTALAAPVAGDGTRRGASIDGQVEVVLTDLGDGRTATIETDDGTLTGTDYEVTIEFADAPARVQEAAGG